MGSRNVIHRWEPSAALRARAAEHGIDMWALTKASDAPSLVIELDRRAAKFRHCHIYLRQACFPRSAETEAYYAGSESLVGMTVDEFVAELRRPNGGRIRRVHGVGEKAIRAIREAFGVPS